MERNGKQLLGSMMLMLCAMIWGLAFVAQSAGMEHVGPCTFNAVRNFIACVALLPVILLSRRFGKAGGPRKDKRLLWGGGALCGLFLCAASLLQQIGIQYTSVGKAGFLTALYIVIVPVMGIFLGRRPGRKLWFAVAMALAGAYLLSVQQGFSVSRGDTLLLLCAVLFSVHILLVDHFAPSVDGVQLSCIQFLVSGILSLIPALLWEDAGLPSVLAAWLPLLYTGVLSSGVGYTLQILGQSRTNPTVASLILSLESVFAALAGWLLKNEALTPREVFGCVLVFAAVITAQLPGREGLRFKKQS